MPALFSRMMSLLILMAGGAALASLAGAETTGTVLGIVAGALIWLIGDNWLARAFADWLHHVPDEQPGTSPPRLDSARREAAERIQRLLRRQRLDAEELENRLHNIQSALQASPNGVIILNEQECIEWCNRTACEHFGLDSLRDLSQRITHLLRAPVLVKSLAMRDFGEALTLESPLSTAARPLRLEVRIFPYGHGRLFMLSRDITAIEQAEAMKRDFVANVSHEIRTPLTVLAGFIETLQTLPLEEEERTDMLCRMAQQSDRMKSLVDDLLTLSRLEGSAPPGIKEWTPVRALLEQLGADARALSALLAGQNAPEHELIIEGMDTSGEIAGSASELQSAFFNLVNNAIRYTPPGGKIVVRWQAQPNAGACFSVQDSGPGIAPEHIPRLTERFYRVDSDRSRASGGTGLGLSIVKHVLQRHDATLAIDSAPSKGACFTATFPAVRIRAGGQKDIGSD
ncbi:MAG: phosphate regulon sensor histidine kinase PhoR [Azoarcus sp.]|jgi:two-component system phosphate regulon sensor histidine kinase PhoR|nr:phosphate regulon sensor histidine kinase PhoR [Azoarcus sp.]